VEFRGCFVFRFRVSIVLRIVITGIEKTAGLDIRHRFQDVFAEVGRLLFPFGDGFTDAASHGAGAERTAAGNDGHAFGFDEGFRQFFVDVDQGPDDAEIALAGDGDGRQRADAAGIEDVTEELFAEIVGRVAEGNDIGAEAAGELVDGAAAEAAAEVAAVIGLVFEEFQGRVVGVIGPIDAEGFDVFADGGDGGEEFALLDGEGADGEIDGGAFLEQEEDFEHGDGILAAGDSDGEAVAMADHVEAMDGFADFAE